MYFIITSLHVLILFLFPAGFVWHYP